MGAGASKKSYDVSSGDDKKSSKKYTVTEDVLSLDDHSKQSQLKRISKRKEGDDDHGFAVSYEGSMSMDATAMHDGNYNAAIGGKKVETGKDSKKKKEKPKAEKKEKKQKHDKKEDSKSKKDKSKEKEKGKGKDKENKQNNVSATSNFTDIAQIGASAAIGQKDSDKSKSNESDKKKVSTDKPKEDITSEVIERATVMTVSAEPRQVDAVKNSNNDSELKIKKDSSNRDLTGVKEKNKSIVVVGEPHDFQYGYQVKAMTAGDEIEDDSDSDNDGGVYDFQTGSYKQWNGDIDDIPSQPMGVSYTSDSELESFEKAEKEIISQEISQSPKKNDVAPRVQFMESEKETNPEEETSVTITETKYGRQLSFQDEKGRGRVSVYDLPDDAFKNNFDDDEDDDDNEGGFDMERVEKAEKSIISQDESSQNQQARLPPIQDGKASVQFMEDGRKPPQDEEETSVTIKETKFGRQVSFQDDRGRGRESVYDLPDNAFDHYGNDDDDDDDSDDDTPQMSYSFVPKANSTPLEAIHEQKDRWQVDKKYHFEEPDTMASPVNDNNPESFYDLPDNGPTESLRFEEAVTRFHPYDEEDGLFSLPPNSEVLEQLNFQDVYTSDYLVPHKSQQNLSCPDLTFDKDFKKSDKFDEEKKVYYNSADRFDVYENDVMKDGKKTKMEISPRYVLPQEPDELMYENTDDYRPEDGRVVEMVKKIEENIVVDDSNVEIFMNKNSQDKDMKETKVKDAVKGPPEVEKEKKPDSPKPAKRKTDDEKKTMEDGKESKEPKKEIEYDDVVIIKKEETVNVKSHPSPKEDQKRLSLSKSDDSDKKKDGKSSKKGKDADDKKKKEKQEKEKKKKGKAPKPTKESKHDEGIIEPMVLATTSAMAASSKEDHKGKSSTANGDDVDGPEEHKSKELIGEEIREDKKIKTKNGVTTRVQLRTKTTQKEPSQRKSIGEDKTSSKKDKSKRSSDPGKWQTSIVEEHVFITINGPEKVGKKRSFLGSKDKKKDGKSDAKDSPEPSTSKKDKKSEKDKKKQKFFEKSTTSSKDTKKNKPPVPPAPMINQKEGKTVVQKTESAPLSEPKGGKSKNSKRENKPTETKKEDVKVENPQFKSPPPRMEEDNDEFEQPEYSIVEEEEPFYDEIKIERVMTNRAAPQIKDDGDYDVVGRMEIQQNLREQFTDHEVKPEKEPTTNLKPPSLPLPQIYVNMSSNDDSSDNDFEPIPRKESLSVHSRIKNEMVRSPPPHHKHSPPSFPKEKTIVNDETTPIYATVLKPPIDEVERRKSVEEKPIYSYDSDPQIDTVDSYEIPALPPIVPPKSDKVAKEPEKDSIKKKDENYTVTIETTEKHIVINEPEVSITVPSTEMLKDEPIPSERKKSRKESVDSKDKKEPEGDGTKKKDENDTVTIETTEKHIMVDAPEVSAKRPSTEMLKDEPIPSERKKSKKEHIDPKDKKKDNDGNYSVSIETIEKHIILEEMEKDEGKPVKSGKGEDKKETKKNPETGENQKPMPTERKKKDKDKNTSIEVTETDVMISLIDKTVDDIKKHSPEGSDVIVVEKLDSVESSPVAKTRKKKDKDDMGKDETVGDIKRRGPEGKDFIVVEKVDSLESSPVARTREKKDKDGIGKDEKTDDEKKEESPKPKERKKKKGDESSTTEIVETHIVINLHDNFTDDEKKRELSDDGDGNRNLDPIPMGRKKKNKDSAEDKPLQEPKEVPNDFDEKVISTPPPTNIGVKDSFEIDITWPEESVLVASLEEMIQDDKNQDDKLKEDKKPETQQVVKDEKNNNRQRKNKDGDLKEIDNLKPLKERTTIEIEVKDEEIFVNHSPSMEKEQSKETPVKKDKNELNLKLDIDDTKKDKGDDFDEGPSRVIISPIDFVRPKYRPRSFQGHSNGTPPRKQRHSWADLPARDDQKLDIQHKRFNSHSFDETNVDAATRDGTRTIDPNLPPQVMEKIKKGILVGTAITCVTALPKGKADDVSNEKVHSVIPCDVPKPKPVNEVPRALSPRTSRHETEQMDFFHDNFSPFDVNHHDQQAEKPRSEISRALVRKIRHQERVLEDSGDTFTDYNGPKESDDVVLEVILPVKDSASLKTGPLKKDKTDDVDGQNKDNIKHHDVSEDKKSEAIEKKIDKTKKEPSAYVTVIETTHTHIDIKEPVKDPKVKDSKGSNDKDPKVKDSKGTNDKDPKKKLQKTPKEKIEGAAGANKGKDDKRKDVKESNTKKDTDTKAVAKKVDDKKVDDKKTDDKKADDKKAVDKKTDDKRRENNDLNVIVIEEEVTHIVNKIKDDSDLEKTKKSEPSKTSPDQDHTEIIPEKVDEVKTERDKNKGREKQGPFGGKIETEIIEESVVVLISTEKAPPQPRQETEKLVKEKGKVPSKQDKEKDTEEKNYTKTIKKENTKLENSEDKITKEKKDSKIKDTVQGKKDSKKTEKELDKDDAPLIIIKTTDTHITKTANEPKQPKIGGVDEKKHGQTVKPDERAKEKEHVKETKVDDKSKDKKNKEKGPDENKNKKMTSKDTKVDEKKKEKGTDESKTKKTASKDDEKKNSKPEEKSKENEKNQKTLNEEAAANVTVIETIHTHIDIKEPHKDAGPDKDPSKKKTTVKGADNQSEIKAVNEKDQKKDNKQDDKSKEKKEENLMEDIKKERKTSKNDNKVDIKVEGKEKKEKKSDEDKKKEKEKAAMKTDDKQQTRTTKDEPKNKEKEVSKTVIENVHTHVDILEKEGKKPKENNEKANKPDEKSQGKKEEKPKEDNKIGKTASKNGNEKDIKADEKEKKEKKSDEDKKKEKQKKATKTDDKQQTKTTKDEPKNKEKEVSKTIIENVHTHVEISEKEGMKPKGDQKGPKGAKNKLGKIYIGIEDTDDEETDKSESQEMIDRRKRLDFILSPKPTDIIFRSPGQSPPRMKRKLSEPPKLDKEWDDEFDIYDEKFSKSRTDDENNNPLGKSVDIGLTKVGLDEKKPKEECFITVPTVTMYTEVIRPIVITNSSKKSGEDKTPENYYKQHEDHSCKYGGSHRQLPLTEVQSPEKKKHPSMGKYEFKSLSPQTERKKLKFQEKKPDDSSKKGKEEEEDTKFVFTAEKKVFLTPSTNDEESPTFGSDIEETKKGSHDEKKKKENDTQTKNKQKKDKKSPEDSITIETTDVHLNIIDKPVAQESRPVVGSPKEEKKENDVKTKEKQKKDKKSPEDSITIETTDMHLNIIDKPVAQESRPVVGSSKEEKKENDAKTKEKQKKDKKSPEDSITIETTDVHLNIIDKPIAQDSRPVVGSSKEEKKDKTKPKETKDKKPPLGSTTIETEDVHYNFVDPPKANESDSVIGSARLSSTEMPHQAVIVHSPKSPNPPVQKKECDKKIDSKFPFKGETTGEKENKDKNSNDLKLKIESRTEGNTANDKKQIKDVEKVQNSTNESEIKSEQDSIKEKPKPDELGIKNDYGLEIIEAPLLVSTVASSKESAPNKAVGGSKTDNNSAEALLLANIESQIVLSEVKDDSKVNAEKDTTDGPQNVKNDDKKAEKLKKIEDDLASKLLKEKEEKIKELEEQLKAMKRQKKETPVQHSLAPASFGAPEDDFQDKSKPLKLAQRYEELHQNNYYSAKRAIGQILRKESREFRLRFLCDIVQTSYDLTKQQRGQVEDTLIRSAMSESGNLQMPFMQNLFAPLSGESASSLKTFSQWSPDKSDLSWDYQQFLNSARSLMKKSSENFDPTPVVDAVLEKSISTFLPKQSAKSFQLISSPKVRSLVENLSRLSWQFVAQNPPLELKSYTKAISQQGYTSNKKKKSGEKKQKVRYEMYHTELHERHEECILDALPEVDYIIAYYTWPSLHQGDSLLVKGRVDIEPQMSDSDSD